MSTPVRPDPMALITFRGKKLDRKTAAAMAVAEQRLGYELTIVQGYNPSNMTTSAGTHGKGAVDLAPYDQARKVKVLRDLGFAAWYRPPIKGLWNAHIHAVMIGHQQLTPPAARQVAAFKAGRDGLASNAIDTNKYRPQVKPFNYAVWWNDGLLEQKIHGLQARRKKLLDRISALKARRARLKAEIAANRKKKVYS